MSDRQAEISRSVGISTKGVKSDKGESGKKKLLRVAGAVAIAAGATAAVSALRQGEHLPSRQNLESFVGPEPAFSFDGFVELKPGTAFYNQTALETSERPEGGIITSNLSGNTFIGELREGDGVKIEDPIIWFGTSLPGYSSYPDQIRGSGEVILNVFWSDGWLIVPIFDADMPEYIRNEFNVSPTGFAATPIGGANLEFINSQGETHIIPNGFDIKPLEGSNFGNVSK